MRTSIAQCLLLLVGSVPAVAQDLVTPSDRVITFVHVREAAAESSASIGQLQIGQGLPLTGTRPQRHAEG